jgi:L-malate glycosyltransferase
MEEISILHLDSERGWRGGQQQAIYLFEYLLQHGYRTEFICRKNSKLESYLKSKRHPYQSLSLFSELDFFSAKRIANYARKKSFTILHLHAAHAVSIGIFAKLFYPKLKIIAVRRVDFSIHKNMFSQWKYKTDKLDKIVAISENIRKVLINDGIQASKIEMIRSGVDVHKFDNCMVNKVLRSSLNIPENAILVGTVAALVGHKDYPNFLRAAEKVIQKSDNIHFIAVGDGPKQEEIFNFANSLNLQGKFHFLGYRDDVGSILKTIDIFVLASRLEGLGTSVLDAMSIGLAVIGTDAGGIPEMIENEVNGIVVPKENQEALAEAILKLAENRDMQAAFSHNSLQKVQLFSKDCMATQNIELYEKLTH